MDLQLIVLLVLSVMLLIKVVYLMVVKKAHKKPYQLEDHHSGHSHHGPF
ncbi:hypothetical protein [Marinomonas sp.]